MTYFPSLLKSIFGSNCLQGYFEYKVCFVIDCCSDHILFHQINMNRYHIFYFWENNNNNNNQPQKLTNKNYLWILFMSIRTWNWSVAQYSWFRSRNVPSFSVIFCPYEVICAWIHQMSLVLNAFIRNRLPPETTAYMSSRFVAYLIKAIALWAIHGNRCSIMMFCVRAWWRHQRETFSVLLVICVGNSRTKASDAELWCFLWSAPE